VEIFPQHAFFIAHHAIFIAQQMLDQILRICKSSLKIGFFGHFLFLLFQNQSSYIHNNKLFAACEESLEILPSILQNWLFLLHHIIQKNQLSLTK
jgi:hypothetical protein